MWAGVIYEMNTFSLRLRDMCLSHTHLARPGDCEPALPCRGNLTPPTLFHSTTSMRCQIHVLLQAFSLSVSHDCIPHCNQSNSSSGFCAGKMALPIVSVLIVIRNVTCQITCWKPKFKYCFIRVSDYMSVFVLVFVSRFRRTAWWIWWLAVVWCYVGALGSCCIVSLLLYNFNVFCELLCWTASHSGQWTSLSYRY